MDRGELAANCEQALTDSEGVFQNGTALQVTTEAWVQPNGQPNNVVVTRPLTLRVGSIEQRGS